MAIGAMRIRCAHTGAPHIASTFPVFVQIVDSGFPTDAALHNTENQEAMADAISTTRSTTVMADVGGPVCADATAAVGAVLQPCGGGTGAGDPDYDRMVTMRTQIVTFLLSAF